MDPLVLSRLAPLWNDALAGAVFAGLRPAGRGALELVFDRAPDAARPARRLALVVHLAPPVWAWLEDAERGGGEWQFRLPEGSRVRSVEAPAMDRRIVLEIEGPAGGALAFQLELWPPGNVIAEVPGTRVLWCARARPASTHRAALAPGAVYAPPSRVDVADPSSLDASQLEAWLGAFPAERWLTELSRHVAGLPKAMLDALVPTLPREAIEGTRDFAALADALHSWARETYGEGGRVWGVAWDAPSPGATLVTRTIDAGGPAVRVNGPYAAWDEAAAAVGRALPEPLDADALTAARAEVRRLARAEAAVRGDLESAGDATNVRADADALAAFLPRVVRGAASVELPDPADSTRMRTIALDPTMKPHENLDRLYKRAGKLERTLEQAPARLAAVRAELEKARARLEALERGEQDASAGTSGGRARRTAGASALSPASKRGGPKPVSSVLEPRRYKTNEGWDVLIGKNNQGNDHLTHRLARPEDIWMHVHGAAGSHVVIRRGKGPNEPSKATLQEVAAWAAFYSQARNAGTVPVTVTQKKYVRKPRKAPAGLAQVERSKTVFAKPAEPPDEARVNEDELVKRFFLIVILGSMLLVGLAQLVPSFTSLVFGSRPRFLQDGDIIFQNSRSSQSDAIRRATHSPWTHMGVVIYRNGDPYVLEAAATVRMTPFRSWTKRGVGGHYVVKRLRKGESRIDGAALTRAHGLVGRYLRKDYDLAFDWSDDRMYCSELVWKIYMRAAGIKIGDLQSMSTLDLDDPVVQAKLRERYGDRVPLDQPVITPVAMFDCPLLEVVQRH